MNLKNKLCNYVDILENNEFCVLLKVKSNMKNDLVRLGFFESNESMYRLTKGEDHICTVYNDDGTHYSWEWGKSGHTLVSENLHKKGNLIEECIVEDFDIYIGDNKDKIRNTMSIMSLEDSNKAEHYIEIMHWANKKDISVRKDGEFYKCFDNINSALNHFKSLNYDINYRNEYVAKTGCIVKEYYIIKDKQLIDWKEDPYFDLITNLDDINDYGNYTVARVCDGLNCTELHYNNGMAIIEYGTRIDVGEWESEVENISWFNKNMDEEILRKKIWDLFEKKFDKDDVYEL